MTRLRSAAILACLAVLACDEDPAKSVRIATPPPEVAMLPTAGKRADSVVDAPKVAHRPPPAPAARGIPVKAPPAAAVLRSASEWRPDGCPPPAEESAGPSSLVVTGPCTFEQRGAASCEALPDDFLMTASRQAARGATLMVYINVEQYHGPGSYDGAQMFVGVQDKTSIYRWSSDEVSITVAGDEGFAVLPTTRLTAELLFVECTGPMNNYQCEGRDLETAINNTTEVVSGTFRCEKRGKAN